MMGKKCSPTLRRCFEPVELFVIRHREGELGVAVSTCSALVSGRRARRERAHLLVEEGSSVRANGGDVAVRRGCPSDQERCPSSSLTKA